MRIYDHAQPEAAAIARRMSRCPVLPSRCTTAGVGRPGTSETQRPSLPVTSPLERAIVTGIGIHLSLQIDTPSVHATWAARLRVGHGPARTRNLKVTVTVRTTRNLRASSRRRSYRRAQFTGARFGRAFHARLGDAHFLGNTAHTRSGKFNVVSCCTLPWWVGWT